MIAAIHGTTSAPDPLHLRRCAPKWRWGLEISRIRRKMERDAPMLTRIALFLCLLAGSACTFHESREAREAAREARESARQAAQEARDAARDAAREAREEARRAAAEARETTREAAQEIRKATRDARESTRDAVRDRRRERETTEVQ